MRSLIEKVRDFIIARQLLPAGATVVVGGSGGADSVALLHILHALQPHYGWKLHAAHFNHRLRKDAAQDQKFVEALAGDLGLPCSVGQWQRPGALKKISSEDLARQE